MFSLEWNGICYDDMDQCLAENGKYSLQYENNAIMIITYGWVREKMLTLDQRWNGCIINALRKALFSGLF